MSAHKITDLSLVLIRMSETYSRRNKFQQDVLFEALNDFHPYRKLTIEVNPEKFLDIKIILNNDDVVTTQAY